MAAVKHARRGACVRTKGAELIEFAIVLPICCCSLLGIVDFGFLFQRYEVVTNAAREGARVAVLPGFDDDDVQSARGQLPAPASGLTAAGRPGGARRDTVVTWRAAPPISVSRR